ncbi:hypothetical protein DCAR_0209448 [Daucus carota subsp. sativus]|uniref:Rhamnogalacturonase A/B/Epimerase-like pectate lyase domain-containing protein n=2 Tax=Daucus carota subsp. sativus TaxID=79200 RepID=A0A166F9V5_DAUCS|nr:hypothetical protein DCAR_0209448 [Daucus carota subsp. sativus]
MDIIVVIASVVLLSATNVHGRKDLAEPASAGGTDFEAFNCRAQSGSIMDFGGVGDGKTSNTKAFQAAITKLGAAPGGGQLIIPAGKFLTSPFKLASHFTLYLQKDAVILAAPEEAEYPVVDALPSYGKGNGPGMGRFTPFISGSDLTDVVITGDNGTIDGQGQFWYDKDATLKAHRPHLIEIMNTKDILISKVTLANSPSYHFHPVYSSNVIVRGITILANLTTKNTDGIIPDSTTNMLIEDSYIASGEDCVSLKSGMDDFGVKFAKPTSQIAIRRLTCITPTSSLISIGSEMSGGVSDVRAEDNTVINSESGIRIKTNPGRGGHVKDIHVRKITMDTMKWAFFMTGEFASQPNKNPPAATPPVIEGINLMDMTAKNVSTAGQLGGIKGHPFNGICMSNITIEMAKAPPPAPPAWNCSDVAGTSSTVTPPICPPLAAKGPPACKFPTDKLPIETVKLQKCPVQVSAKASGPSASPVGKAPSPSP